jgi:hypothetical protein
MTRCLSSQALPAYHARRVPSRLRAFGGSHGSGDHICDDFTGHCQPAFEIKPSQENLIMRRLMLGSLVFAALAAGGSAYAVDAGSAPAADKAPSASSGKQTSTAKSKRQAVPLSAAMAAEAARASELPTAPIHEGQPSSSTQPSWTGFHIGVGVGAGASK